MSEELLDLAIATTGGHELWNALGYACWNYFTTPFLFAYPGVQASEIEPWREAGQTWRRLQVRFPPHIGTHSPSQVFYLPTPMAIPNWPSTSPACC
jgi:hypothetical protein